MSTPTAPVSTICASAWNAIPRERKHAINGQPHLLELDASTGATVLRPVTIVPDKLAPITLGDATHA